MFFLCEKDTLSSALTTVVRAAAVKTPMPILEGILLSTDENFLILTTNNTETGIECKIPAIVKENGSIVAGDAKVFAEIVRKLPDGPVSVEVGENFNITVKSQKSVYNIMGMNPEEFPELPLIKERASLKIESGTLRKMLGQTSYAISNRPEKPTLTGSLFEIDGEKLTIVSIDGFRMALCSRHIKAGGNEKFIIPGKTLLDIARIIRDDETPLLMKLTDKYVLFEYENTRVLSRLIEGEFFNYKAIIPPDFKIKINVETSQLLTCVERTDPIVSVDIIKNPIKITVEGSSLYVDCVTSTGKIHDVIEINGTEEELEIGFNQKYLHDALAACECDEITIEFNGSLNPCVIKPAEGDDFLFLVLPVKLSREG